jgi:Leucine-rich repeat (LRR) protein
MIQEKENVLNTSFILSFQNQNNPKEIAAGNKNISRIGNLCDVPPLTKLNISFNKLLESLDGIEQIPTLKEFWCYGCSIHDLQGLSALSKAEILHLNNNRIESVSDVFKSMGKLRELRLDGNRLKKIESLQSCQFLRRLDLSHNAIASVDGLSGLQSLQELKLNNNKLTTISSLRGLPALMELDVSHNYLKSLDGIQHFLKLEIVRGNYNHMVHLQFQSYANSSTMGGSGKATVLQTSSGSTPSNSSRSIKQHNQNNNSSGSTNKSGVKKNEKGNNSSNADSAAKSNVLPTLDKPVLTELYLSGNKIRSISGLELFQHCLEIIDVSRNQITDVMNITAVLRDTHSLAEFHLYENPCCEDATQMTTLQNVLTAHCTRFIMPFEAVISPPVAIDIEDMYHHPNGDQQGVLDAISIASREFHTWTHEESSTILDDEAKDGREEKSNEASNTSDAKDENSSKGKKKAEGEDEENDDNEEINRMFLGPKLLLKSMLTQEQIFEREQSFRNLLSQTKERLNATVFQFLYPDSQPLGTAAAATAVPAKKAPRTTVVAENADTTSLSPPPTAADKLREVLERTQAPILSTSSDAKGEAARVSSSKQLETEKQDKPDVISVTKSTHIAMPKQLFRSNSSSSKLLTMSVISEGSLESASPPPSKPARMSSNTNIHQIQQPSEKKTLDLAFVAASREAMENAMAPLSERSLLSSHTQHTTQSNVSLTSKTKKKLHAQISATSLHGQEKADALDVRKLSSNVTSHGTKPWKSSGVEKDAYEESRQEFTQRILQSGIIAPEDRVRHEEELLAFSTVKIMKQKPGRTMLVDSNINVVVTHKADLTTNEKELVPAEDDNHPLTLSAAEKMMLEREVSTPLTQLVARQQSLLLEKEEEEDDDDREETTYDRRVDDVDQEAVVEEEEEEGGLASSPVLPSVEFMPKSIGFDRRYLEETDDVSLGSAPVLITPRDLSTFKDTRNAESHLSSVGRAHSAPQTRPEMPLSSSSQRTPSSMQRIVNVAETKDDNLLDKDRVPKRSAPTTPVSALSTATKVSSSKSGVQGGRLIQPTIARSMEADIHTQSMSSLLRFQLPPDLQRMIDSEDKQNQSVRNTGRTSVTSTPRNPSSTIGSAAASASKSLLAQSTKEDAKAHVLFSDEDESSAALLLKRGQLLSDPVAAGKEQWVERIEAKIFALSTKEAKSAVQMTTPHYNQLPSPSFFHPQGR